MIKEHDFAPFIRILGKGPHLSRALTEQESYDAADMIMQGNVLKEQLTAYLCLLRVKTETIDEMAGFIRAVKDHLEVPDISNAIDLDWPSYAGKSRRLPYFLISALLLAQSGVKILIHGAENHTAGRLYTRETLEYLGVKQAKSLKEAQTIIAKDNIAFIDIGGLSPILKDILSLKSILGLRNPVHSISRALNPFNAPYQILSVAHNHYLDLHRDTAQRLKQPNMIVFKGEGGEAEVRPDKTCHIYGIADHKCFEESWSTSWSGPSPEKKDHLDPRDLKKLWDGDYQDDFAASVIIATSALILKMLGRVQDQQGAYDYAKQIWHNHLDKTL